MKNNKGFSLVELIVVIAIMAVLVGVLAPSLLRYVEKARVQKDTSAMAEVTNAIQLAMGEEAVYDEVTTQMGTGNTISYYFTPDANGKITVATAFGSTNANLASVVASTIDSEITINSKEKKSGQTYVVTVAITGGGAVTVNGAWVSTSSIQQ